MRTILLIMMLGWTTQAASAQAAPNVPTPQRRALYTAVRACDAPGSGATTIWTGPRFGAPALGRVECFERVDVLETMDIWSRVRTATGIDGFSLSSELKKIEAVEIVDPIPEISNAPGRFTLLATQNMYTFLLLDSVTGKLWQCHWTLNEEGFRGCVSIR